jgi:hypothetical protein
MRVMSMSFLAIASLSIVNKSLRRYNNQTGGNPEMKEAEVYLIASHIYRFL